MQISDKVKQKIAKSDEKVNKIVGWDTNDISKYIDNLLKNKEVEVGYRAQCGSTHFTQKVYREFSSVIATLKKEGINIVEENKTHGNRYATNNGGFWNSIVFKIA